MKRVLFVCSLVGLMGLAMADEVPDSAGNRQAAAERYLEVSGFEVMVRHAAEGLALNLHEDQRQQFVSFFTDYVHADALRRTMTASMVRHFTLRELNALADFYGSPAGQSALHKFGVYMADVTPAMEQEIARAYKLYLTQNQGIPAE